MAKDSRADKADKADKVQKSEKAEKAGGAAKAKKMSEKAYRKELDRLSVELVKLQEWAVATGARICVLFEGRDGAGKDGTIKAIMERVNSRVFRVVALPAPTEREKSQMYMQRYVAHLPAGGEIILFDRSWYNRAGVERVMGFCTEQQAVQFLHDVPLLEQAIQSAGVTLLKYWLEISPEEQTRRLESRIKDARKVWKLSPMDLESYRRWYDYSRARDDMIAATDTDHSPWFVVHADEKKRARLNLIHHLLSQIPYEEVKRREVSLPARQKDKGYVAPEYPYRFVPEAY